MKSSLVLFLSLIVVSAFEETQDSRSLQQQGMIPLNATRDECKVDESPNGENIYGPCDPSVHFPSCQGNDFVCFNRINRRDKFYPDKQPYYYIDPRRVFCYPETAPCSPCAPGRYCLSEQRCILDPQYSCSEWLA